MKSTLKNTQSKMTSKKLFFSIPATIFLNNNKIYNDYAFMAYCFTFQTNFLQYLPRSFVWYVLYSY